MYVGFTLVGPPSRFWSSRTINA